MIRVAGAQVPVLGSVELNGDIILNAIDQFEAHDVDILLTPEGSLSGYFPGIDQPAIDAALGLVLDRARELNLGLALGTCFTEPDGKIYNEIRFYNKDGVFLGFHSKILKTTGEKSDYESSPLRTFDFHGTCIGGLICNDLWANPTCTDVDDPFLPRKLSEQGARIIFHAINGGRSKNPFMEVYRRFHESNLQIRAQAAHAWVVTADNCFPFGIPCSAPSGVVSPIGEWVARVPDTGEQFFYYDIDL